MNVTSFIFKSWNAQDNIIKDELTDDNLILFGGGGGAESQSNFNKGFFSLLPSLLKA